MVKIKVLYYFQEIALNFKTVLKPTQVDKFSKLRRLR